MIVCQKCSCCQSLSLLRNICTNSVLDSNHYKVLGLNSSATHAEIKSAYYELSKKHHPDKNRGSEKSANTFKAITAAYEILGNKKLRKQYDKEQNITGRSEPSFTYPNTRSDYSDEFDRFFYERIRNKRRKYYYGKTAHFDYDTWYSFHYGKNEYQNKYYKSEFYTVRRKTFFHDDIQKDAAERFERLKLRSLFTLCLMTTLSFLFWCGKYL